MGIKSGSVVGSTSGSFLNVSNDLNSNFQLRAEPVFLPFQVLIIINLKMHMKSEKKENGY